MDTKTLEALFEKIARLTEKRAIQWEMQTDGSFLANFPRSSIELEVDYNTDPKTYRLNLYNSDGVVIAHVADDENLDFPEKVAYLNQNVEHVYHLVKAQVYKTEDTASDLFAELDKLEKKIGLHSS